MGKTLLLKTNAYKIVAKDVKNDNLSHAYLVLCQDEGCLREYLKEFAKLIVSGKEDYEETSREITLIEKERHPDVTIYPAENKKIVVEDIDNLVENSYVKPLESKNRIFILVNASLMNAQSQNKLLKTLEEPPKGVCILIGATGEARILPTVLSRVKKLSLPTFTEEDLFAEMSPFYKDHKKLKTAIALSGGKKGEAMRIYGEETALKMRDFAVDVLLNMDNSKKVLEFSCQINKDNVNSFLVALETVIRDVLVVKEGGKAIVLTKEELRDLQEVSEQFKTGALLEILDRINDLNRARYFNSNVNMTADEALFCVLEEKYKWQKL